MSALGRTEALRCTPKDLNVIPDDQADFFFSIAVRGGNQSNSCLHDHDSSVRIACGRHLQWALHRGVRHGCQPAMFWRTPILELSAFQRQKSEFKVSRDMDRPGGGTGAALESPCLLTTHLSQSAHDFVFLGKIHLESDQEESISPPYAKRKILIYTVAPNEMVEQISLIKRMWSEAAKENKRQMKAKGTLDFEAVVIDMEASLFDERHICFPDSNNRSTCDPGEYFCDVPVDQLAAVRGAGLLLGYPAFVFDCNPSSVNLICADINGSILAHSKSSGLDTKLKVTCEKKESGTDLFARVEDRLHKLLQTVVKHGKDNGELDSLVWDVVQEMCGNGQKVVTMWLHHTEIDKESVGEVEFVSRAEQKKKCQLKLPSFSSPLFTALYERNNKKRTVLITGAYSDMFMEHLCPNKDLYSSKKGSVEATTLCEKEGNDTLFMAFPWNNSSEVKFLDSEHKFQFMRKPRPQWCPIQTNDYIINIGIAASIAGRIMSARIHYEGKLHADDEKKRIIGKRVAKHFIVRNIPHKKKKGSKKRRRSGDCISRSSEGDGENHIFLGHIVSISKKENEVGSSKKVGEDWFLIKYDDGDSEHVSREELDGEI